MKRIKHFFRVQIVCAILLMVLTGIIPAAGADASFSQDPAAIEQAADSVFMLEVYSSRRQKIAVGSGFVAFDASLLVTNYHVIEGGAYVIAISDDQDQYLLNRICCSSKTKDIAILQFDEASRAKPLPLNADTSLMRAEPVVAIGSPAGLKNTVSLGNISAFYTQDGKDWIQFTAPISSGSSGGALLNDQGEVIGITTATYASAQNINMAVRIGDVVDLYNRWNKTSVSAMGNMSGNAYPQIAPTTADSGAGVTVWVTKSGKKYHSSPTCSKMTSPVEMDLLEAIERGYTPCGKCYK